MSNPPMQPVPAGVGRMVTAMVTPFHDDGRLDLDGAQRLAAHLLDHGTETVLVSGTTGESPTLSGEEPWELLRAVREAIGSRGTVMMGTGTNDTRRTVESTERATRIGADAILLVTPYYSRPPQRGLVEHFTAAAAATDLPVVVYDVPARTGRSIAVESLVALAEVVNIVGVKDATTDVGKAADVVAATRGAPGGFELWCGSDEVNLPLLAVGGVGLVSVSSHILGDELAEMVRVFDQDPVRARELHLATMPVHRALFSEPSPSPLKGVLNALGLPAGPVRGPLAAAAPVTVQSVLDALERLPSEQEAK